MALFGGGRCYGFETPLCVVRILVLASLFLWKLTSWGLFCPEEEIGHYRPFV